ncbi:MAG: hypothetical protein M3541_02750 [Acidobacteriota bacterium]|nr:hypothetical protein [Acidobacteriota bacterium]
MHLNAEGLSEDVWGDIIDLHFPDGDGYIAVLRAYVDASHREESGLFSVSAYLFESRRVRRFRQVWRDTFGYKTFSWADLIARTGQFKHLRGRENNTEHTRLVAAGVSLVREYSIAGVILSCWQQDVENFSPRWIRGFGHAYSIGCHVSMAAMGRWAKRNNYRGGIAYVLEAGDDYSGEANDLLSYAAKIPEAADQYQWTSHSFVPKDVASPFHAPDLLAWEWGKFMTESVLEKKRPMRMSLAKLLVDRLDRYSLHHLSGDPLMRYFNQLSSLGAEQIQEERDALSSASEMDLGEAVRVSPRSERDGDPE